jgi:phytoene dehydrogenase-like protein|tara:strand:- start:1482 stop:2759 length:1278 start_codon:yes stop_codon:yes gene_type:complete
MSPSKNLHSAPLPSEIDVLVVGAGLAGLSCARLLSLSGINVHVVEASSSVGGRVKTDEIDGFLLDRGFQVLLTSYSELQNQIDLKKLDLRNFKSGGLIWSKDQFHLITDPLKHPSDLFQTMKAKVGTLADKLKTAKLKSRLLMSSPDNCFNNPDSSTQDELESLNFSNEFIEGFFRPFLGGVYLEKSLNTSSSLFKYYFRCFASGDTAIPAKGIQRLPELFAEDLEGRITLGTSVIDILEGKVLVKGGSSLQAREVVLAVDGPSSTKLTGSSVSQFKSATTAYFSTHRAPSTEPVLILDGENHGPVNHLSVISNVCPDYAPEGMHLVSVSGVGIDASEVDEFPKKALEQLREWFGPSVESWSHLRTYFIPYALPEHPAGSLPELDTLRLRRNNLIQIGDYTTFGSIQGALLSGRKAAELILRELD